MASIFSSDTHPLQSSIPKRLPRAVVSYVPVSGFQFQTAA